MWSRNNISATMERFEPTRNNRLSSSASSREYGFADSVVTSMATSSQPPQMVQTSEIRGADDFDGIRALNHVYSYAYYDPGVIKCHTNIPTRDRDICSTMSSSFGLEFGNNAPRKPIRTLLSKGFPSKSSSSQTTPSPMSVEGRHTYTTRYGTTENLYEEVNEQKIRKVLSDNRIAISASTYIKEELRRVQHNHFRVLDELNLSLEALIMPPSPLNLSPNSKEDQVEYIGSVNASTGTKVVTSTNSMLQKRSLSKSTQSKILFQTGVETKHNLMDFKDQSQNTSNNPEFDEGDLDSGFSGSGSSSGASYNESLQLNFKTDSTSVLPKNENTCCSPTSSDMFISKSSMNSREDSSITTCMAECYSVEISSSFDCTRRLSDTHHSSIRSISAASSTGAKPKINSWIMKP